MQQIEAVIISTYTRAERVLDADRTDLEADLARSWRQSEQDHFGSGNGGGADR